MISHSELVKELKGSSSCASQNNSKPIKVLLTGNIVFYPMVDILSWLFIKNNVSADITEGNYDNVAQDVTKSKDQDFIILFWDLLGSNLDIHTMCLPYEQNKDKAEEFKNIVCQEIINIINLIPSGPKLIINEFSFSSFSLFYSFKTIGCYLCSELNKVVREVRFKDSLVAPVANIFKLLGRERYFDGRFLRLASAPYTYEFYFHYSKYIKQLIFNDLGKRKKVLILDCDNTLWKGIVGEDGADNIEVFREIQSVILNIEKQGGLICLASKNNKNDVIDVLENNKNQLIKKENIILMKVNWSNKYQSILEIQNELNLSLESFVFLDDSDFEIGMVKEYLPQVTCIKVPNNYDDYLSVIHSISNLFYSSSSTSEDKNRTNLYRIELKQKNERKNFADIDDYLISQGMSINVTLNSLDIVARLSQLSQRTNQFNLTSIRHSESNLRELIVSDSSLVVAGSMSDKFGERGVTALAIIDLSGDSAEISSFMLSCRVLGRRVEFAFLSAVIQLLRERSIVEVRAKFIQTNKNKQVADFWAKVGFSELRRSKNEDVIYYSSPVELIKSPENISMVKVNFYD